MIKYHTDDVKPHRPLGQAGRTLWDRIQAEYGIHDVGGIELLTNACTGLDRAEALAEAIAAEGVVVPGRFGAKAHPAIAAELAARSFVAKMLQKLGIT
jgi:hypothetical protein